MAIVLPLLKVVGPGGGGGGGRSIAATPDSTGTLVASINGNSVGIWPGLANGMKGISVAVSGNLRGQPLQFAYDITSNSGSAEFGTAGLDTGIADIWFSADGEQLWTGASGAQRVRKFVGSTPWTLNTYNVQNNVPLAGITLYQGIHLSEDGLQLFVLDGTGGARTLTHKTMSSAFNPVGIANTGTIELTDLAGVTPKAMFVLGGTELFIICNENIIYQYSFDETDVSATAFVGTMDLPATNTASAGIWADATHLTVSVITGGVYREQRFAWL